MGVRCCLCPIRRNNVLGLWAFFGPPPAADARVPKHCCIDYRPDRDVGLRANRLPGDEWRGDTARGGDQSRKVRRHSLYLRVTQAQLQALVQVFVSSAAACSAVVPVHPQSRLIPPTLQMLCLVANRPFVEMHRAEINRAPTPRGSYLSSPVVFWQQGFAALRKRPSAPSSRKR